MNGKLKSLIIFVKNLLKFIYITILFLIIYIYSFNNLMFIFLKLLYNNVNHILYNKHQNMNIFELLNLIKLILSIITIISSLIKKLKIIFSKNL